MKYFYVEYLDLEYIVQYQEYGREILFLKAMFWIWYFEKLFSLKFTVPRVNAH